jgi:hypothetical protein
MIELSSVFFKNAPCVCVFQYFANSFRIQGIWERLNLYHISKILMFASFLVNLLGNFMISRRRDLLASEAQCV